MGKASLSGRIVCFVFYPFTQAGKFFAAGAIAAPPPGEPRRDWTSKAIFE